MLKITIDELDGASLVRVEGRLARDSIAELERACDLARTRGAVRIALADITYVDDAGRALLERLHAAGADFSASGCATRHLVYEITGRMPEGCG